MEQSGAAIDHRDNPVLRVVGEAEHPVEEAAVRLVQAVEQGVGPAVEEVVDPVLAVLVPSLPELRVVGGQPGGLHRAVHPVGPQLEVHLELLRHSLFLLPPRTGQQIPAHHRGQHSRMIQAICRRREGVLFFMRDASKLQNTPPGTAGYLTYSMFRPSRPRKASICRAVSAALSPVSISQNTRSRGSVPEKRLTTQPPPLK